MEKEQFQKAVSCVASNCIDYKSKTFICDEELLRAVVSGCAGDTYKEEDFEEIFNQGINLAKTRKRPVGSTPPLVRNELIIGIALLLLEIYVIATAGFIVSNMIFILMALSQIGGAAHYYHSAKNIRKLTGNWKAAIKDADTIRMTEAFKGILKELEKNEDVLEWYNSKITK